jgi:hypothetical protein
MIVHPDDQNLPPAGTSSFYVISEHFSDIRYKAQKLGIVRARFLALAGLQK